MLRIELAKLADHIARHDPDKRFFDFLHEQSLEEKRDFLDRYRNGDWRGAVFHAAAIRHIYVHGHLTASPNKCETRNLTALCEGLTGFILALIASDFQRRLTIATGTSGQIGSSCQRRARKTGISNKIVDS